MQDNFQEMEVQKEAERIYKNWHKKEKIWSTIVLHNELDAIETSLISMKANIETKEYKKSVEEIDKSIFLLRHIYEKEKFCLKNIL